MGLLPRAFLLPGVFMVRCFQDLPFQQEAHIVFRTCAAGCKDLWELW